MPTISVKVSEEEARLIRSRAGREGVSVSEYLRRRPNIAMSAPRFPPLVRCPRTGAMIFGALDDRTPLDTATVRELLSDWP